MNPNTINQAALFSLCDLNDICESIDEWAVQRARLPHVGEDLSIDDAMAEPRFSKAELLIAFEAVLNETVHSALA